jgi:hypothetical protein
MVRKGFAPIAFTAANYQVSYAGFGQPLKQLPQMIACAKAHPGKSKRWLKYSILKRF